MYKVLIIDDESIIVEGLMRVVPWHSYHCKVIGTAFDGKEGTLAIRKHCPDIVITDIRMPGIDGLSMISGIKSEFPNMQIMILTGFRDFAYAQEAIKLGVTRFLLKPSKLSEIDEALKAMTLNLSSRQKDAEPGAGEDTTQDTIEAASSFIVRHAIEYMEEHYAGKISLSEVAAKCYVSQWHLSKLLNKHARQNFYEILNNIRIREAKNYYPILC